MAQNLNSVEATPRKRSGWGRKLGIIGFVLVLLLVVAYFVGTSSAFFKGVILPQVSKMMDARITVSDASIHPFSEIVLHDIKYHTTGPEPLFYAQELRVTYKLSRLLGGAVNLNDLTMKSPVISWVIEPDGKSNMDPFLVEDDEPPLQMDIRRIVASNGTIRMVKLYEGGKRDVTELANVECNVTDVKNGATGKATASGTLQVRNDPPDPSMRGSLHGSLKGDFAFGLADDLMPTLLQGSAQVDLTAADGVLAQAAGLTLLLNSDITQTEIKQLLMEARQGGAALAQFRLYGPFDLNKLEGRVNVELSGVDKRVLNLATAGSGMDFGTTKIGSTNQVELSKGGDLIKAIGSVNVSAFQVIQTNQASPPLDLVSRYDVEVDMSRSNAVLRTLALQAVQQGKPLITGDLSSPMNLSWGSDSGNVGDSTFNLSVPGLNFADWKAFMGEVAPAGVLSAQAKLTSLQSGKLLNFEVNSQIRDLTVLADTNRIEQVGVTFQTSGSATNLADYNIAGLKLQLAHKGQVVATASGSGSYQTEAAAADFQIGGGASVNLLAQMIPQPDVKVTSGDASFRTRLTQASGVSTVVGNVALTNFSGQFGSNSVSGFASSADLEATMDSQQGRLRKLAGTLFHAGQPGGRFAFTGSYQFTNSAAEFTAEMSHINQNGLKPFAQAIFGNKELLTIDINGNAAGKYLPEGEAAIKADLQIANLVVKDPAKTNPLPPQAVKLNLDAGMEKDIAEIRTFQISLTPTQRATNVVQVSGRLDMSNTNATQGNLKIAAEALDLTSYYDIFEAPAGTETSAPSTASTPPRRAGAPAASSSAEQELEPMTLPLTNFVAETSIARLYLREVEITNWQTTVKVNGGRVLIEPLQLALNGALVSSKMDLDLGVPGWKYNTEFRAVQVPLTPVVNSFVPEKRDQVKGTLTGTGAVNGAGTTGASLRKNLQGNFDIGTTNLNLSIPTLKSPLLKTIINVIAVVPQLTRNPDAALSTLSGALFGGRTGAAQSQSGGFTEELMNSPIDIIQARGTIGQGYVKLEQALVQSPAFQAGAQGTVELADVLTNSPLQVPLTVSLRRSLAEKINFVPAGTPTNLAYIKLPDYVSIQGTVGEPQTRVNKAALLGTALQQIGNIPGVDQKTGNLLQNLSGVLGGNRAQGTNAVSGTNQPSGAAGLLQGLRGVLGGTSQTNPVTGTNQPAPPVSQTNRSGSLLQSLGGLLGGAQAPTNAPAGTNHTAPGTNRAERVSGLLQGLLRGATQEAGTNANSGK